MNMEWLSGIKGISDIAASLNNLVKSNRATKDMLIRELELNIKAFHTAQKSSNIDYDRLLDLLQNKWIQKARESYFTFSTIKRGNIEIKHVNDERNKRYVGKNCEWLFKNIDKKIEDLRGQKQYNDSLKAVQKSNIALQFSNLFYKMKLLAEFVKS